MARILTVMQERGLLLQQDKTLPNVVALVAGETLTTSWWNHKRSDAIFRCLSELEDHPDVLFTKLVGGKVTLVHRELWSAVLAVGIAQEGWQFQGLSAGANELWAEITRQGKVLGSGPHAKELETRLLVHSEQVHTAGGRHQTQLETWQAWAERVGCRTDLSAQAAKARLETVARELGCVGGELPWEPRKGRRKKPAEA